MEKHSFSTILTLPSHVSLLVASSVPVPAHIHAAIAEASGSRRGMRVVQDSTKKR